MDASKIQNSQLLTDIKPDTLIYDSHLVKTFRACGEKFRLFEVEHWVPNVMSAAPSFGIAMHEGIAIFRTAKRDGQKYPEAYQTGAKALLESYKKHMPPVSQSEVKQDDKRSAQNALRIFTGYCEHYEPQTLKFPHVEIPFAILLGQITSGGVEKEIPATVRDVIYVGIIDAVIEMHGALYVNDLKTTAWSVAQSWLDGFQVDQGMMGYVVAARELLGIESNKGLIHGMWIASAPKSGKGKPLDEYFHTKELLWDEDQLSEWRTNTLNTIEEIELRKQDGKWQMDFGQNCGAFGGCPYRNICGSTPNAREQLLKMDCHKAVWTPLEDERLTPLEA